MKNEAGSWKSRPAEYRCRECNGRNSYWTAYCVCCNAHMMLVPAKTSSQRIASPGKQGTTLADIAPLVGKRVSTGIDGLDDVLGSDWRTGKKGLHVPSVVLFAGAAGCGKSTLVMRVAVNVSALYISSEQPLSEIRANADRWGLDDEQLSRVAAHHTTELSDALDKIHETNAKVVIVDSLNELVDSENDTNDTQANLIRTTTAFKEEAEQGDRAIFLIAHMNKKEEIAGVQRVQHIVSAVMIIEARAKSSRILHCPHKNRFGDTSEQALFRMTPRGLIGMPKPEEEPQKK